MASNLKPKGWIKTNSGIKFDIFKPKVSDVNIEDIAHSLSLLCRFNGNCRKFYSVAQHSVLVSHIIDTEYSLEGLLHDAPESITGDIIRPMKIWLPDFAVFEDKIDRVIAKRFGLLRTKASLAEVKRADNVALVTEARDLVNAEDCLCEYCPDVEPLKQKIKPWSFEKSKREFLKRFEELTADWWQHTMTEMTVIDIPDFKWKQLCPINTNQNTQIKKSAPLNT